MTIQENTICSLIQSFPVFLILAQNHNKCLKTPFVYKPPSPTPSTEYYEALDALFQTLFGQDCHKDHHYPYSHQHHYDYGKTIQFAYGHGSPCHSIPKTYYSYGSSYGPPYGSHYGSHYDFGHNKGYPTYITNRGSVLNISTDGYRYGVKQNFNKYKIVVKTTRVGHKKRAEKLQDAHSIEEESCIIANSTAGSCVSVYNCSIYYKLLKQSKSNPSAVMLLRNAHCGFDGNIPKVCCPPPKSTTSKVIEPSSTNASSEVSRNALSDLKEANSMEDYVDSLPEPPVCGVTNFSTGHIVGHYSTELGDLPWMALLGYRHKRFPTQTNWLCGGSLITERHVLTAAHCIHNHETELYVVRLGEVYSENEDDAVPMDLLIKRQIKHEEFNSDNFTSDIGLLVLQQNVIFSDEHSISNPKVVKVSLVSPESCRHAYSVYQDKLRIDGRVLCAASDDGGRNICQGFSGGPLLLGVGNNQSLVTYMYQIGVESYGTRCTETGLPEIYSSLTHFMPWLEEKLLGGQRRSK